MWKPLYCVIESIWSNNPHHHNLHLKYAMSTLQCLLYWFKELFGLHSVPRVHYSWGFEITWRRTNLSLILLAEGSACHRDLKLTTHNIHERQTTMALAGFKPANKNLSMPTEFIWLRVGTMGSCQHGNISGFHNMYKICWSPKDHYSFWYIFYYHQTCHCRMIWLHLHATWKGKR